MSREHSHSTSEKLKENKNGNLPEVALFRIPQAEASNSILYTLFRAVWISILQGTATAKEAGR
jgi:hypothetical protein